MILVGCGNHEEKLPIGVFSGDNVYLSDISNASVISLSTYEAYTATLIENFEQYVLVKEALEEGYKNNQNVKQKLYRWKNDYYNQILIKHEVFDPVRTDSSIYEIYNKMGKRVGLDNILIKHRGSNKSRSERNIYTAKQLADSIWTEIVSDQLDFSLAALHFSEEPNSSGRNGFMGFIEYGKMLPEIIDVIWESNVQMYPKPILSDFGYHIVRVRSSQIVPLKSLSEMRNTIITEINSGNSHEIRAQYDKLEKSLITYYDINYFRENITLLFDQAYEIWGTDKDIVLADIINLNSSLPVVSIGGIEKKMEWINGIILKMDHKILDTMIPYRYDLYKSIKTILNQLYGAKTVQTKPYFDSKHFNKIEKNYFKAVIIDEYIKDKLLVDRGIKKEIILNQLFIKYNVKYYEDNIKKTYNQLVKDIR